MKDNTKAGDGSVPESTYKAEYAEHLWFALVDCLTVDLAHGESTFYRENRINKDVFREMMANQGSQAIISLFVFIAINILYYYLMSFV